MERTTEWDETNNSWCVYCNADSFDKITGPISRLAAYEDLGLTPDEIAAQLQTYSALLCELTRNRLSKTNYALEDLLPIINDIQSELCEECKTEQHVHNVYSVTVVDYVCGDAQDPSVFIFDNEVSANECFKFLSNGDNKVFITKEEVYGSFCVGGEA